MSDFWDSEMKEKCSYYGLKVFDITRYILSSCLLIGGLGIIIYEIIQYHNLFWPGQVPFAAVIVILFALLWILGILEGFQVAVVELSKRPVQDIKRFPRAHRVQLLVCKGQNLEKFVLGRQLLVLVTVFFLANATTIVNENTFPIGFQESLLSTGLLGTIVVATLGQLIPQILAAQFPNHFANFPLMELVFRICLIVEGTGIIHASRVFGLLIAKLLRFEEINLDAPALGPVPPHREADPNLLGQMETATFFSSVPGVATKLQGNQLVVPFFLHPSDSPNYVPPHIASLALLAQSFLLQSQTEAESLRKKEFQDQAFFCASMALEKVSNQFQL